MRTRTGRRPFRPVVAAGLAAVAVLAVYAFAIEPRLLVVTRVAVRTGRLAAALDGRRVALLSDLHFSGDPGLRERVLRALDVLRPDMLLLTGDLVRWRGRDPAYGEALDFLARLRAPLGVFAVLGDADTTSSRRSCAFCHEAGSGAPTRRHGVRFLRDEGVTLATGRGEVRIAGLAPETPDPGDPRPGRLTAGEAPVILLAHSSRCYRGLPASREVLVLSGDTHGGQVRLPRWFWRATRRKPDPEHFSGLFRDGAKSLFVTRGLGTSWPHLRLGEPPEIVVLEFGVAAGTRGGAGAPP